MKRSARIFSHLQNTSRGALAKDLKVGLSYGLGRRLRGRERIQPRLLRDIRTQELKEDGISIQVTDAIFQGSHRHGRWPRDRFDGAGF